MLHKRDIISRFLHSIQPRSMLDVGCGDHEVLSALPFTGRYTGLDISEIIIDVNSRKFPEKSFRQADFVLISEFDLGELVSDAVLCLEVLIHQHASESYRRTREQSRPCYAQGGAYFRL